MNEDYIQYMGESGITRSCLLAISAILNSGCLPESTTIVTIGPTHHQSHLVEEHLFLFWNWGHFSLTVVPSGFASGYSGGGPRGFSLAVCMIRSKQIPIYHLYVNKSEFEAIDKGNILDVSHPLYQRIKISAQRLPSPYYDWILPEHEELLERGQLWRAFTWYSEPKCDWITKAIADVGLYHPEAGKRLRLALDKLEKEETKEWQSTGILIRDAWIELTQQLCQDKNIDTSDIRVDAVKERLKKLKLGDEIEKLMGSAFNLSLKIQHDRETDRFIAKACVISTAISMQTLIYPKLQRGKKTAK